MAAHTLITTVSRRSMLTGGTAALALSPAAALAQFPAIGDGDARIAALAGRYRRATADLAGWIAEAERRHGPCAYEGRPKYKGRYDALTNSEDRIVAALARAQPDGIRGLAIKMWAAICFGDLLPEFDARLLIPALRDLDRMAGGATPLTRSR